MIYTHDLWNRLVKVQYNPGALMTRFTCQYNALNWLIVKVADATGSQGVPDGTLDQQRCRYYSAEWQLLEERIDDDIDAQSPDGIDRHMQYIWGPRYIDDIVYRRENSDFTNDSPSTTYEKEYYHLTNVQFSTLVIIDNVGKVLENGTYDAYGRAEFSHRADLNNDRMVTLADNAILAGNWNITYPVAGDLNRDGVVDSTDSGLLHGALGDTYALGQLSKPAASGGTDNIIGWCGYMLNPEMPGDGGAYTVRYRWYVPGIGRWVEKDPLGNPRVPVSSLTPRHYDQDGSFGGHAWGPASTYEPSPGMNKAVTRGELVNLYRYVRSNPVMLKDSLGLQPEEAPDVPGWNWGGSSDHENWEDWLAEYDRQMACCTCLVYSEGGNESQTCMEALVHVMWNRQHTGWHEHRQETSFCQQANQPAFEGGVKNRKYRNCRDCVQGLPPAEGRSMERAEAACRKTIGTQVGADPTGGAQFWYGPGYLGRTPGHWMHDQIRRGNCARVNVPGCRNEFYRCKSRPLA